VLYMSEGNRAIQAYEIRISSDGRTNISWKRKGGHSQQEFKLNSDEMALLKTEIDGTDFFNAKFNPEMAHMHCSAAVLRISISDRTRTVRTCGDPSLGRLETIFVKLYFQAVMLANINDGERIYDAASSLDPTSAGTRILQPRVLREPLKALVRGSTNRSNLTYALAGLTHLMTPEEWTGFISDELAKSDESRRLFLLDIISAAGSDTTRPRDHTIALLPIIFREIKRDYSDAASFSRAKRSIYAFAVYQLCNWRYAPAVPFLVKTLKESDDSMQDLVISDIEEMLDHPKPRIRQFGASQLTNMWGNLENYRIAQPINPLQTYQKTAIERQLKQIASSKLEKMAKSDSVDYVRESASTGVKWIGRPWKK
jgi:hypothetical protein